MIFEIILILKFFLEFGVSWNRKYFFGGVSVFEEIVG